jgi:hypothetical protein
VLCLELWELLDKDVLPSFDHSRSIYDKVKDAVVAAYSIN